MPIDGGALVELVLAADTGGNPVSYASDDQFLYWVGKSGAASVRRVAKTGGAVETLWTHDETMSSPTKVRVDATHVYWVTQYGSPALWRVTK